MTLQKGLLLALPNGTKHVHIEGDSLLVINAVNNIWKAPSQIHFIIEDKKSLLRQFNLFQIKHIYREANKAED